MCKDIAGCAIIIVNVLFLLVSSALIIIGALLQWGGPTIQNQIIPGIVQIAGNSTVSIGSLGLILNQYAAILGNAGLIIFIIGIILFVICICGTCGVCCKNRCLMIIYLICTLVIWVLIVIFIIVFFTQRSQLQTAGSTTYTAYLQKDYVFTNGTGTSSPSGLQASGLIDLIQGKLQCCGANNYTDFFLNPTFNKTYGIIPFSCCMMVSQTFTPQDPNCTNAPTTSNSYLNNGCYTLLWNIISNYFSYAAYGLVGLAIILLILLIIAGVLQKKYRDRE